MQVYLLQTLKCTTCPESQQKQYLKAVRSCAGDPVRCAQSQITVLPACSANCTRNAKIKTGLVVIKFTRVFLQAKSSHNHACKPLVTSFINLVWLRTESRWSNFVSTLQLASGTDEQRRGEQNWQTTDHPYTIPSYMHQKITLNNIPVNTVS